MHVVDKATHDGSYLRVLGWCFKSNSRVVSTHAIIGENRFAIEGYGRKSEDLIQHFGEAGRDARFDFEIPTRSQTCVIEITFDDSSTSRIAIDLTAEAPALTALEHRIHNKTYSGKFLLLDPSPIESVHFLPKSDDPNKRSAPLPFTESSEQGKRTLTIETLVAEDWDSTELGLLVQTATGSHLLSSIGNLARSLDRSHQICAEFFESLCQAQSPLKVVEIGSRARSGITRKHQFGERNDYIGFDILDGPNVDVVGDIHSLSSYFPLKSLDAIAGFSVFEHVAMPWKAAIEINKVLKLGGRCLFHTHQTWPVHESPYDFWRFSTDSWRAIFNKASGFKIIEAACGEAATIHPLIQSSGSKQFEAALGYLSSSVLVEKISDTNLNWDVDIREIHQEEYPA
ncbi:methyltransferase domain-containing protein [Pelagicoccus sp. SDUM812005]|uniref:methyltransferase domain-containing protein n=1 Tax=Pelagicoccus sp. SDUM812005 TaxID=3041257 RepID=UPI00280F0A41|nr:methyltransferase domain-containing protein [Pelagicoccus sp. SDUM812005]MDQ8179246.1 methyltransferase domain-containing protein [Pelagicoccus sp. SDUM812005]